MTVRLTTRESSTMSGSHSITDFAAAWHETFNDLDQWSPGWRPIGNRSG